MNRTFGKRHLLSMAVLAGGIGAMLASPVEAKTRYYLLEDSAYPGTYEWVEPMPTGVTTIEKTVTIEKPVMVEKYTRTTTTRYVRPRHRTVSMKRKTHYVARAPIHRTHLLASQPTYSQTITRVIEKPVKVERIVETPMQIEKPMVIEKAVAVDRPVLVEKPRRHLLNFSLF